MAQKIANEELRAEALFPQPFTGRHWAAYRSSLRDNENEDPITRGWRAALAVLDGAHYEADGSTHKIDEDAPLAVLVWLSNEVPGLIVEQMGVEKNSSSPPSRRRTAKDAAR